MAGTNTFTGTISGNRETAGNWSLGHVPTDGTEDVVMGADSTSNTGASINCSTFDTGGYSFTGSVGETLTVATAFSLTSGGYPFPHTTLRGADNAHRLTVVCPEVGSHSWTDTMQYVNLSGDFYDTTYSSSVDSVNIGGRLGAFNGSNVTNVHVTGQSFVNSAYSGYGSASGVFDSIVITSDPTLSNISGTFNGGIGFANQSAFNNGFDDWASEKYFNITADRTTTIAASLATARAAIVADKANIVDSHAITISGMTAITGTDRGTYPTTATSQAAVVLPTAAKVMADAGNYGISSAITPTLALNKVLTTGGGTVDLTTYTLKTDVVSASWVVTGHDNYVGGSGGTYPTTATSQAAQLATDTAAVNAAKGDINNTRTLLTVTGTQNLSALIAGARTVAIIPFAFSGV